MLPVWRYAAAHLSWRCWRLRPPALAQTEVELNLRATDPLTAERHHDPRRQQRGDAGGRHHDHADVGGLHDHARQQPGDHHLQLHAATASRRSRAPSCRASRSIWAQATTYSGPPMSSTPLAIAGGSGVDTLNGGAANDVLAGNEDGDTLNGAGGVDEYFGEDGADTIISRDGIAGAHRVRRRRRPRRQRLHRHHRRVRDRHGQRRRRLQHRGRLQRRRTATSSPARPTPRTGSTRTATVRTTATSTETATASRCPADCDDGNAGVRPNAIEVRGNAVDENCDRRADSFAELPSLVSTSWKLGRSRHASAPAGRPQCPGGGADQSLLRRRAQARVHAAHGHARSRSDATWPRSFSRACSAAAGSVPERESRSR